VCGAITRVLQRESIRIDNIQQTQDEIHQRKHASVNSASSSGNSMARSTSLPTGTYQ
jgi:hypothetical protein